MKILLEIFALACIFWVVDYKRVGESRIKLISLDKLLQTIILVGAIMLIKYIYLI